MIPQRPAGQSRGIFPVFSRSRRHGALFSLKRGTPRKSRVALARFERRTVLSLDRACPVPPSARRRSRRRKHEEENAWGAARRGQKGEGTPGRRRNARRGSTHARTYNTHVRHARTYVRTYIYEGTKRIEWALASPGRGLVTSACRRRLKEKQE